MHFSMLDIINHHFRVHQVGPSWFILLLLVIEEEPFTCSKRRCTVITCPSAPVVVSFVDSVHLYCYTSNIVDAVAFFAGHFVDFNTFFPHQVEWHMILN